MDHFCVLTANQGEIDENNNSSLHIVVQILCFVAVGADEYHTIKKTRNPLLADDFDVADAGDGLQFFQFAALRGNLRSQHGHLHFKKSNKMTVCQ